MSPRKKPTSEELTASRNARIVARRLDQQERYLALLGQAQRLRQDNRTEDGLADEISRARVELEALRAQAGGRIVPRRRPFKSNNAPETKCTVFLDECGSHNLGAKEGFDAFVLSAVIVDDHNYPKLDEQWKQWKVVNLGASDKLVHEPDVRKGNGPFYFDGDRVQQSLVRRSLGEIIGNLDFGAMACVIHRPDYLEEIGVGGVDDSLPTHLYLMTLDFLTERLVMALESHFGGARARLVAEARGPREDALLQYEHARLQLDGTSYVSDSWIRQQLAPGIDFKTKRDNCTGLELADLLARPCGEKVLCPSSTPDRWPEFRNKLCLGQETAHSILGLKCFPWQPQYEDIWKS